MTISRLLRHRIGGGLVRLSTMPFECGAHVTRYTMYSRLKAEGRRLPSSFARALSVSHSSHLAEIMNVRLESTTNADYPKADLLNLDFADESFDIVLSDQVLEHVEGDPQQAINESLRVLKPGGYAVHTTCFIVPKHSSPSDFWRFTPEALELLCRGFSEVRADGWGNPLVWPLASLGLIRMPIPHARWHPLNRLATYDHDDWPICTWVVARK